MRLQVNKQKAIQVLEQNRERHLAEYELQMEAWKKAYTEHTESLNRWAQDQSTTTEGTVRPAEPQKPKYYGEHYDKLIGKLSVHELELIELDDSGYGGGEYEKIFENEFEWSGNFMSLSGSYITSGHINSADISTIRD